MQKSKLSPPIQMLQIVWENANKAMGFSWQRLNSSMQDALSLAISAGMRFDPGDFKYIAENFRFDYWGGSDGHMFGERYYRQACNEPNKSACRAFEKWRSREPFIADNVNTGRYWGDSKMLSRSRLAIGFEFYWNGETVTVTSFSIDGSYLTACSYQEEPKDEYAPAKIKHRYKITVKDLKTNHPELKKLGIAIARCEDKTEPLSPADTAKRLQRTKKTIAEAWKLVEEWEQGANDTTTD